MKTSKIEIVLSDILAKKDIEKMVSTRVIQLQAVIEVTNDDERGFAYEMVAKGKKEIKLVEDERKKITKVIDEKKKLFMDIEKEIVSVITPETVRVTNLIAKYDREIIKRANEEQERFTKQIEEQRALQAKEQKEIDDFFFGTTEYEKKESFYPAVVVPQIALPKGTVETKAFRVLDLEKVPNMFKILDETKVRQAMKDGITIAGIEYYLEQKTTFR